MIFKPHNEYKCGFPTRLRRENVRALRTSRGTKYANTYGGMYFTEIKTINLTNLNFVAELIELLGLYFAFDVLEHRARGSGGTDNTLKTLSEFPIL